MYDSCPGGYQLRAFVGWSVPLGSTTPSRCTPPAEERCLGWDAPLSASKCGSAYSGPTCDFCSDGHYQAPDRSCQRCPGSNYGSLLSKLWPFVVFIVVVFVTMFLIVWRMETRISEEDSGFEGAPPARAVQRVTDFCVWLALSAQILASSSSSTVSGVPETVIAIYTFVSFFNFDTCVPS